MSHLGNWEDCRPLMQRRRERSAHLVHGMRAKAEIERLQKRTC
jgi:hypothetical protein